MLLLESSTNAQTVSMEQSHEFNKIPKPGIAHVLSCQLFPKIFCKLQRQGAEVYERPPQRLDSNGRLRQNLDIT